ncbi:hypothetical protein CBL_20159, partial [Carabus blaptoides fortunei]
ETGSFKKHTTGNGPPCIVRTPQVEEMVLNEVEEHPTSSTRKIASALNITWKDKRIVTILSSYDTAGTATIERRLKQGGTINISEPNELEICAINSYILHKMSARKENRTPISHFMFVRKLVEQLVGDFREGASSKPGRPSASG